MIFLIILHIIVSLVLILVILLQAGKGGGLSEAFGGASQQIFGSKSSTFLNRATSVCAILFLVTCLSLGILSSRGRMSLMETVPTQTSEGGIAKDVTESATEPLEDISGNVTVPDEELPEKETGETPSP